MSLRFLARRLVAQMALRGRGGARAGRKVALGGGGDATQRRKHALGRWPNSVRRRVLFPAARPVAFLALSHGVRGRTWVLALWAHHGALCARGWARRACTFAEQRTGERRTRWTRSRLTLSFFFSSTSRGCPPRPPPPARRTTTSPARLRKVRRVRESARARVRPSSLLLSQPLPLPSTSSPPLPAETARLRRLHGCLVRLRGLLPGPHPVHGLGVPGGAAGAVRVPRGTVEFWLG